MIITPLKTTTTFSISSHDRVKKKKKGKFLVVQLCSTLCDHMDYIACQAPLSMGFSRQEYWSGLLLPPPVVYSIYCIIGYCKIVGILPCAILYVYLFYTQQFTYVNCKPVSCPSSLPSSLRLLNVSLFLFCYIHLFASLFQTPHISHIIQYLFSSV